MTGSVASGSAAVSDTKSNFSANRRWWIAGLLFVLAIGVFFPVGSHEFINYDDPDYVTSNAHVQPGLTSEGIQWAFSRLHGESTYWHPVTWISHMLDCQFFGLNASAHHFVNALIHALNVTLLFFLLYRMTGSLGRSLVVSALFAVHPLQVDTVAWVAERKNVLSTFWLLLTLVCYERYARRRGVRCYGGALGFYAVGLMTKPMLVTAPGILLLLDYWPLQRIAFERFSSVKSAGSSLLRLLLEKLPFFLLAAGSATLTVLAHEGLGFDAFVRSLSLSDRIANAVVSYGRYLGKVIWPHNLAVFYPHPGHWSGLIVFGSFLLAVGITALAGLLWRKAPWVIVGWFWFLGTLLPVIGIIQAGLQAMADRFIYVPLVGLLIAVVWSAAELLKNQPALRTAVPAVALLACIVVTERQLTYWQNSERLWQHALAVTKNNFIAEANLGHVYTLRGDYDKAWPHITNALALKTNLVETYYNAGYIKDQQRQYSEAIPFYEKAVELKGDWSAAHRALLEAYYHAGATNKAIVHLRKLIAVAPENPGGHIELAQALVAENRLVDAVAEYHDALRFAPNSIELLNNLAWLLATSPNSTVRNGKEAVHLAEQACELTQWREPVLIGTLAAAHAEAGNFDKARELTQKAIDLARVSGQPAVGERNRKLLELYKRNQPYRDTGVF